MVTEKKQQQKDERIDLIPLLKVLLSRLWLIILVGLVVASATYGLTKLLIKPTYRCGFTAYVNNQHAQSTDKSSLANSDLLAAQQLTKTLSYIIRSNTILSASLDSINSDLSFAEFSKMVYTDIKDETELINVYVVNEDPELAYELARAIADTAPKYMAEIVEGSSMKIVDYPVMNTHRYSPSYLRFAIIGFLVGVLIVIIKTLIDYFTDDKIKSEQEIEERFDIPILGVIPDISGSKNNGDQYAYGYGYGYAKQSNEDKEVKEQ